MGGDSRIHAHRPCESIRLLRPVTLHCYEVEEEGFDPAGPDLGDEFVAAIQWVDGTTLDGVRRVKG